MTLDRRRFLALGSLSTAALWLPRTYRASAQTPGTYGPLLAVDPLGLQLPAGFTARVIATSGERVPGTGYEWHVWPDGGATFPAPDGGWIYVSNSEVPLAGGSGAIRFDSSGEVVDAYRILDGTDLNCAGGPTPWGTWLSCEEHAAGQVWECDPTGEESAVPRPALGRFTHEAAAVDPATGAVYLTEDQRDGGLYRFTPDTAGQLHDGRLEIAAVDGDGVVAWLEVPDPSGAVDGPLREQVPDAHRFARGEGAWFSGGLLWFTTTGDGRVRSYDPATGQLLTRYDEDDYADPVLSGVDNLTVSPGGDVFVAEDHGNMELVHLTEDGAVATFLRITGQDDSEITGPTFDPSGNRLYVSSQRGGSTGLTYEVTGPFRGALPPPATPTPTVASPSPTVASTSPTDPPPTSPPPADGGGVDAGPIAIGVGAAAAAGLAIGGAAILRRRR